VYRDLIVIGGSAGGIEALKEIVARLPADFPAAVLVVLHTSGSWPGLLPKILGRATVLHVSHPADGTPMRAGHIYIAPPDYHMLVKGNVLRVLRGPRENLHRPAIDPLFRSAAVARGARVIGVIVTGMLDDGTSGLVVVKARGGTAIVQDPATAMFAPMPGHALEQVPDALVLPVEKIGDELVRLVRTGVAEGKFGSQSRPDSTEALETDFLEQELPQLDAAERPGQPSRFACPDCGGVLWEIEEKGRLRYRCRVGHAFTERHLSAEQQHATETALWSALRALEESGALYQRLTNRAIQDGHPDAALRYQERADNTDQNARVLREFLTQVAEPMASG
jgi:two-component system chemotaxis response regulator CheB